MLSDLAVDPTEATRRSIMRGVMQATARQTAPGRRVGGRPFWLALAAAVVLLILGTVTAFASSTKALPASPTYMIRVTGEDIRLALAGPKQRQDLRVGFARDRFQQAREIARTDRADARQLVSDGRGYLAQTRSELSSLSANEQGEVQNELDQAESDAANAENQVDQSGANQG
jgi:hypothetical protein